MFIFPMMGQSSRFLRAGYTVPKYELPLAGSTVLTAVLCGFERYFSSELFVFAIPAKAEVRESVTQHCQTLGIRHFCIIEMVSHTAGQADTVYRALKSGALDDEDGELIIFNIDTFRPGFQKPDLAQDVHGYLEVFSGPGDQWSFIQAGPEHTVLRTTEKDRISDWCSDGLYQFRSSFEFRKAFEHAWAREQKSVGEYYVAPLYNHLIANGLKIVYRPIAREDVIFCGVPQEYEALLAEPPSQLRARLGMTR